MQSSHNIRTVAVLGLTVLACGFFPSLTAPTPSTTAPPPTPSASQTPAPTASSTPAPSATASPTEMPPSLVPNFAHIVMVVFENKEFGNVIGNPQMPYFNELAASYALLTQHYAVTHPSLPNYLALISGDTFGLSFNCTKCIYDAVTLPDLIEKSGRTWKAYMEGMPSPCFAGAESGKYDMKHNPFMYFESIRLDPGRCSRSVVPMQELYADLAGAAMPNYAFITPNSCNAAHDCGMGVADDWLKALMMIVLPLLDREQEPYLVLITWDEGQGEHGCCGLPKEAGGRVATLLVSPQVQRGFEDDTPYTHYSILRTIAESWRLPYLGRAADDENALITAPWLPSRAAP